jgi:hypothetical protein
VQPVEPRVAWTDALASATHFGVTGFAWPVPPEWSALVAAQEPAVAVPFALGNFPQLVRDLQPLVGSGEAILSTKPQRPLPAGELTAWAQQQLSYPVALLAAGVLRLAQHFDSAETVLGRAEHAPSNYRAIHANEMAALAWQSGRHAEALAMWEAQPASVPVLFNRGLALLFLNRPTMARGPLTQAVAELKETSAWHHLGQLYLTLAKARS